MRRASRSVPLLLFSLLAPMRSRAEARRHARPHGRNAPSRAAKNAGADAKAAPEAEAEKAAPDTRPRLKRDDVPAPVATPAPPAGGEEGRAGASAAGRPPADATATRAGRARRDIAACGQVKAAADAAIEGCTAMIEDQKQKPKGRAAAYFNRGNAHSPRATTTQAIADYDEAIKLDPKNASAYNNRGNAKNDKGENDARARGLRRGDQAERALCVGLFQPRQLPMRPRATRGALKDFDAAIRYNRRNVNAYIARGALLLASGATAKARADMRQAAALDRKNAYAVLWHDIAERRAKQKGVLGRQGPEGRRDERLAGAGAADVRRRDSRPTTVDRGGRSECGGEGRRIPARRIFMAASMR